MNLIKRILTLFTFAIVVFGIFTSLPSNNTVVSAQGSDSISVEKCKGDRSQFSAEGVQQCVYIDRCAAAINVITASRNAAQSFTNLFLPGKFIPLIPNECSTIDKVIDGKNITEPASIPLDFLPAILQRLIAFLTSIALYLLSISMTYWGILWILGGFSLDGNQSSAVKRNFRYSLMAFLIILTVSAILFEILAVLGVKIDDLSYTSFFFSF